MSKKDTVHQYKIEVSTDNEDWTEVVDKTNNKNTAVKQTSYFGAKARYVRITVTGGDLASFNEFRVFKNEAAGEDWNIINMALGKPAMASSEQSGNVAGRAVDGSDSTRWSASDGHPPGWLQVDLGENKAIVGTEVTWYHDDRAYQYKIEVSKDNVNWTKVVDMTDNLTPESKSSDSFEAVARYVRVTITGGWPSIREFSVLGDLMNSVDTEAPVTTSEADQTAENGWYRLKTAGTMMMSTFR